MIVILLLDIFIKTYSHSNQLIICSILLLLIASSILLIMNFIFYVLLWVALVNF